MSNFLTIATVTATLCQIIRPIVAAAVSGAEVTTKRPDDFAKDTNSARVNIILYQVVPGKYLRNDDISARSQIDEGTQYPQLSLDLNYLLTFYGDYSTLVPERLLGRTVSLLNAQPIIAKKQIQSVLDAGSEIGAILDLSNFSEQEELVKLSLHPFTVEDMARLWSGFFQTPYNLSVVYQASGMLLDADNKS